jgi:predicted MFS family arabinose efflux permease
MFGLLNAGISATMILGFQFIPRLQVSTNLGQWAGLRGGLATEIFALYALLAGVSFVLLARMRLPSTASSGHSGDVRRGLPRPTELIGLLSIGLSFIAYGAVWAFLPLLGVAHKLPASGVANATSIFAFVSLLGSIAIGSVPEHVPRWLLGGMSLILVMGGLYALYGFGTLRAYTLGCALCGFYWPFNMPLILGVLARLDTTGRASVLGGSMSTAGSALGPMIAGALIHSADYRPVGWMAAIMCAAAFGFLMILVGRSSALKLEPVN